MPSEPRWISEDEATGLNRIAVAATNEPFQVRDPGLLASALARPANQWHYGERNMGRLAGYALLGIAHNHPFAQGNKRTGLLVASAFLRVHDCRIVYPDAALADLILGEITGEVSEDDFLDQFSAAVALPAPVKRRTPRPAPRG